MNEVKQDQEVAVIEREVAPVQERIATLTIVDEPSAKLGTDYLAFLAKALKRLEGRRQFFVRPLVDGQKRINNEFKAMMQPLKQMTDELKAKLLGYRNIVKEEAARNAEKLNKMAADNGLPAVEAQVDNSVQSSIGNSYAIKRWVWKITDENKIPRELLMIDEKKINALVKAGTRTIKGVSSNTFKADGIEVYQEESISVRT